MSSPRAGGEADKFGNRYEEAWTVSHLLEVLAGRAQSISVEPADAKLGDGAEFVVRSSGLTHVHQVKRQRSDAATWTIKALADEGVLVAALNHIRDGRKYHFISMTPARQIATLSDKAKRSDSFTVLKRQMLGEEQGAWLSSLVSSLGSDEETWLLLNEMTVAVADEAHLDRMNAIVSQALFEGISDPRQASPILGDFILHHLGRTIEREFAAEVLLRDYGLRLRDENGVRSLALQVEAVTNLWTRGVDRELILPNIPRDEASNLVSAAVDEDTARVLLLSGDAGCGKTFVLRQAVQELQELGKAVLVLRLDRLELSQIRTTTGLGQALGIDGSPVSVLGATAVSEQATLIIDQLDAVSLISGRAAHAFDLVAELVDEAKAYPNVKIVLACRGFDVRNDHRIRTLVDREQAPRFDVGNLTDSQLDAVLEAVQLGSEVLTAPQRLLLKVPLHLRLFLDVSVENAAFDTRRALFDAYWDFKRRICLAEGMSTDRFVEVLNNLAARMSRDQRLSLPESAVPDALRSDAEKLASTHLIVLDNRRWAFFHESFFDYVFARYWVQQGQHLDEFLLTGEQELFRRSQVRQVLWSLIDDDEARFLNEVQRLLTSPSVRYHLKEVALAVLGGLKAPSRAAWRLVEDLLDDGSVPFHAILRSVRTVHWLKRLADERICESWLEGDDEQLKNAAIELIDVGARSAPALAARLMRPYVERPEFAVWMRWLVRGSDLEADRDWFCLVRDGVLAGAIDVSDRMLWYAADGLPATSPDWAIELLNAVFVERVHALDVDDSGMIPLLRSRDDGLAGFIEKTSQACPNDFSWFCLNYIRAAAETTVYSVESGRPRSARHFSNVLYNNSVPDTEDMLLQECCKAIKVAAAEDPMQRDAFINFLEGSDLEALQFILYVLLQDNADSLADRIASLLLQGDRRFFAGYSDSPFWETRNLILCSSQQFSDNDFSAVEAALLAFRPKGETQPDGVGYSSFTLLSALPESRISNATRTFLEDCRGRYGEEHPFAPRGIMAGVVQSPVSQTDGATYSDAEWLEAIESASQGRGDPGSFIGGAHELSQVLANFVAREPTRFMRLLTALPDGADPSYFGAALRALGAEDTAASADEVFDFIRHCADREDPEIDRWLGHALRPHYSQAVPLSLIESLVERAIHSPDPGNGSAAVSISDDDSSLQMDSVQFAGMNSARGSLAETLADLLITDHTGERKPVLIGAAAALASDANMGVRSCAARLISASLDEAWQVAREAFVVLLGFEDDRLLASGPVQQLVIYTGYRDITLCVPIVERMLESDVQRVRRAGGSLAAFFGLELAQVELLSRARDGLDSAARAGVAHICARRLLMTSTPSLAAETIEMLMEDPDGSVQSAVAEVASVLREQSIEPHRSLLFKLVNSASFRPASTQLLLTLDHAVERIDALAMLTARRFIEMHGTDVADISTHAAADAHIVAELVVRAYSQTEDASLRKDALDLIDQSLRLGVLNIKELLQSSER